MSSGEPNATRHDQQTEPNRRDESHPCSQRSRSRFPCTVVRNRQGKACMPIKAHAALPRFLAWLLVEAHPAVLFSVLFNHPFHKNTNQPSHEYTSRMAHTEALSKGQANGTTEEPRLRTHTRIAPSSHECLPVCRRTHSVLVHSRHTKVPMHKNQTHQPTTSRIPGRSPHQTSSEPLSLRARCQRQPSQQQRPCCERNSVNSPLTQML